MAANQVLTRNNKGAFALDKIQQAEDSKRKNKFGGTLVPINLLTGSRPVQEKAPDSIAAKKAKLAGKPKKPDFKISKFKPFTGQKMGADDGTIKSLIQDAVDEALHADKSQHLTTHGDKAKQLNYLIALCFNKRDIEYGAGERDLSYKMFLNLYETFPETMKKLLKLFVYEFGSLNDLNKLSCMIVEKPGKRLEESQKELYDELYECILDVYSDAFKDPKQKKNAAKWAPRIEKHVDRISKLGHRLAEKLFPSGVHDDDSQEVKKHKRRASYKLYRQFLTTENSDNLEAKLCAKAFSEIAENLTAVPGRAMNQYKHAFLDEFKYGQKAKERRNPLNEERTLLRNKLQELTQKAIEKPELNLIKGAKTLMPHEIVNEIYNRMYQPDFEVSPVNEAQWKSMVAELKKSGSLEDVVCMCDVSGSMGGIPMQVSIALGLLISEVQTGCWANRVLTFSEQPAWFQIPTTGGLKEKVTQLARAPWGGSTNMEAAINLVLDLAVKNQVAPENMPKTFMIFTDMNFDQAVNSRTYNYETQKWEQAKELQFDTYRKKFEKAGYEFPAIVFWNIRSTDITFQSESDQKGIINLGGFSANLLKSILEGNGLDLTKMSPIDMILETLSKPRYDKVYEMIASVGDSRLKNFEKWSFEDENNYVKENDAEMDK